MFYVYCKRICGIFDRHKRVLGKRVRHIDGNEIGFFDAFELRQDT